MGKKGSDIIAEFFQSKGIDHAFELNGGMIANVVDAFSRNEFINVISLHHEQSCGFAAEGYARYKGFPGLALATSGPGATNLITAIGSCFFDSIPCIFITGQVNTHERKGSRGIRQLAFQEMEFIPMVLGITKAAFEVVDINKLYSTLDQAYKIAMEGRPGPVVIDIAMNVQNIPATILHDTLESEDFSDIGLSSDQLAVLENLKQEISKSERPLILVGGGVRHEDKSRLLDFLDLYRIPVVKSLMGKSSLSDEHELSFGFIGTYGNRSSNIALSECDLLIVLGSRLDIRQTGANLKPFYSKKIYHIDIDIAEINNRLTNCVPINTKVKVFLDLMNKQGLMVNIDKWLNYLTELKSKFPDYLELKDSKFNPNLVMSIISDFRKENHSGYVIDVGNHQMWAAQSIRVKQGEFFETSGGMGAMGFSLPASIGICLASERKVLTCIMGDGCFQINSQELESIERLKLPIKIIVFNNSSLGMLTQFQSTYFNGNYQGTLVGYGVPNLREVLEAYKIPAVEVSTYEELDFGLAELYSSQTMPAALIVNIEPLTPTYPKIAFGRTLAEMEPGFKPIGLEGT
jgi:acetolactate synthase-1/2/3 large subunit